MFFLDLKPCDLRVFLSSNAISFSLIQKSILIELNILLSSITVNYLKIESKNDSSDGKGYQFINL